MRGALLRACPLLLLAATATGECIDQMQKDCPGLGGQGKTCKSCCKDHHADLQSSGCGVDDMKSYCDTPAPPPTGPTPQPPPATPSPPPPPAGGTFAVDDSIAVQRTGEADQTLTTHNAFSATCNVTESMFQYGTSPMPHYYGIPAGAKKKGLVIGFHGGGGDCHQLIQHVHSRLTFDRIMRLGLGVLFPESTPAGSWHAGMCQGPGQPDTTNVDLQNMNTLISNLKQQGLIDDATPIATWGFSNGCNPSLDLRSCGGFQAQHKAAFCGGTKSYAWYTGAVDTTTRIPVLLHIGAHDSNKTLPNGTEINKVEQQQWAYRELAAANITALRCVPQPFPVTQAMLAAVCGWTDDERATMWSWLVANKWVDSKGTVLVPMETQSKSDIEAAVTGAGITSDPMNTRQLQDVLRMANAGHTFPLGCLDQELGFLKAALGL